MKKSEYLEGYWVWIQRKLNPGYVTPERARRIRAGIHAAKSDLMMTEWAFDPEVKIITPKILDRYLVGPPADELGRKAYYHTITRASMKKYERRTV